MVPLNVNNKKQLLTAIEKGEMTSFATWMVIRILCAKRIPEANLSPIHEYPDPNHLY
jgi:hypothetical protein